MTDLLDLYGLAEEHGTEIYWFDLGTAESSRFRWRTAPVPSPWTPGGCPLWPMRRSLAHELGHCETGSFYNRYAARDIRQKYENRANKWAYKKLVPQDELAEACLQGYREPWELAEYFGVTEFFLHNALEFYRNSSILV